MNYICQMSDEKDKSKEFVKDHTFIGTVGFALQGIRHFWRLDVKSRIHTVAAILAVVLGFYFDISAVEWALQLLCIGVLFSVEMLNTAIEECVNMMSPGYNKQAGIIKDLAAGAVLMASLGAGVVGLIIYVPYFVQLFAS